MFPEGNVPLRSVPWGTMMHPWLWGNQTRKGMNGRILGLLKTTLTPQRHIRIRMAKSERAISCLPGKETSQHHGPKHTEEQKEPSQPVTGFLHTWREGSQGIHEHGQTPALSSLALQPAPLQQHRSRHPELVLGPRLVLHSSGRMLSDRICLLKSEAWNHRIHSPPHGLQLQPRLLLLTCTGCTGQLLPTVLTTFQLRATYCDHTSAQQ